MDVKAMQTLFNYHYGMFEPVWDCATSLSAEQFIEESDYSLGSVRNHLVHCLNVDDRWLARLQGRVLPPVLEEADYPDQAVVRGMWDVVRIKVLNYVNNLTEADLSQMVQVELPGRYASPRPLPRWLYLTHVVNHGTDHRAQILARLHELGASTLEQDLVLYLWKEDSEAT